MVNIFPIYNIFQMGVTYSQRKNLPDKMKKTTTNKMAQGSLLRGEKDFK